MSRVSTNRVSATIVQLRKFLGRSPQFETDVPTGESVPHRGAAPQVRVGNLPVILTAVSGDDAQGLAAKEKGMEQSPVTSVG